MTFPILGGNTGIAAYEIDNSLRFNDDDSAKLQRTPSSDGNKRVWTISTWLKRSKLGALQTFFGAGSSSPDTLIKLTPDDEFEISRYSGGYTWQVTSSNKLRDSSAWYHLVGAVDTTQGTASNRVKLYINGVQVSSFTNSSYPSQNFDTELNDTSRPTKLGTHPGDTQYYDGYMTETHFVDGSQLAPTDFGEFDEDSGIWKPKQYTGTYGTNGFYLKFTNSGTLGEDFSGNDNDFTATNLASTDQTTDTPTNNFATLLPTVRHTGTINLSEGNTKIVTGTDAQNSGKYSTFVLTSGKWYWEVKQDVNLNTIGLIIPSTYQDNVVDPAVGGMSHFYAGIYRQYNNTVMKSRNQSGGANYNSTVTGGTNSIPQISTNDIIMFALDMDNGYLYVGTNGTFHNSADPANGTNAFNLPTNYTEGMSPHIEGDGGTAHINFGNPAYSISSSNSDGNGYGNFEYAPPSGFLALCTQNLATALSPTIDDGSEHFNTVLWTGNGTDNTSITGVGFQPDFLWGKQRNTSRSHRLINSSIPTHYLASDNTNAEASVSGLFDSFDSDGFTIDDASALNQSSGTYVGWNWKAGGTSPSQTYTVKVVSDSGNKYRFDDFGTSAVTLDLQEGGTYTFDQSDSSNSGHPLRFSTTSDGTHGSGTEYTTGVTTTGTAGSAGAKTVITVAASAPTLYYYCSSHSGMGGQANTNTAHGSSNFAGSIQSVAQANTTAGFSIVTYTGNQATGATVGHNLGIIPETIWVKPRDGTTTYGWRLYFKPLGNTNYVNLNASDTTSAFTDWNNTSPTSSVFTVNSSSPQTVNESGTNYIAYCFSSIEGYSKIGSYTGNANADGTFVYTGFKPAWVMAKNSSSGGTGYHWYIWDNKRDTFNVADNTLHADENNAENTFDQDIDFLSNGFKLRGSGVGVNGGTMIYIAFAEHPFVDSNAIPVTAR
jgi:hypothetical protein